MCSRYSDVTCGPCVHGLHVAGSTFFAKAAKLRGNDRQILGVDRLTIISGGGFRGLFPGFVRSQHLFRGGTSAAPLATPAEPDPEHDSDAEKAKHENARESGKQEWEHGNKRQFERNDRQPDNEANLTFNFTRKNANRKGPENSGFPKRFFRLRFSQLPKTIPTLILISKIGKRSRTYGPQASCLHLGSQASSLRVLGFRIQKSRRAQFAGWKPAVQGKP